MRSQRLGCLTPTGLVAALVTILILAGAGIVQGGALFSPGDLNARPDQVIGGVRSHAELSAKCDACHTAPWDSLGMTDRCLACHTTIQTDLADPKTLHGILAKQPASDDCQTCHTEHHGPQASLTRLDIASFPHELTGFSLKGHAQRADGSPFTCLDCHAQRYTEPVNPVCADCHSRASRDTMQKHMQAFGQECLACHDGIDRYGAFDHSKARFTLSGEHAQVDCAGCHQNQTSPAALRSTSSTCAACHQKDDPHQGALGTGCAACHTANGWKPSTFDHTRASFQLTGKHLQAACAGCHTDLTYQGAPTPCAGCHQQDDAHKGSLGAGCAGCHSTTAWKPAAFDHNNAAFKLTGAHTSVTCSACHTNQVFKGTPSGCFDCHAKDDAHNSQFGTDCAACHATDAWSNITFDHAKSQFPLTGAHSGLPCQRCHSSGFRGTSTACSACHHEPAFHAGLFPAECAACHTTAAWLPAGFNGAHTFPINHGDAIGCRDCHTSSLNTYTCYTCHNQNEIINQHREENISNINNCIACHPTGNAEEGHGGGGEHD